MPSTCERFWTIGRVFMIHWTDGSFAYPGGFSNRCQVSRPWQEENACHEIRRFLVVEDGNDIAVCS